MVLKKNKEKGTQIRLSDHFTGTRLIRFVMPSVIMMEHLDKIRGRKKVQQINLEKYYARRKEIL